MAQRVELRGEDLSCYLNSIQSVGLGICLYDKAYFSDITVKNIYKSFCPQDGGESQLALKLRRHSHRIYTRYGTTWLYPVG